MARLMDESDIRKRCERLLNDLPGSGFILFGWEKPEKEYDIVYSMKNVPAKVMLRVLVTLLQDLVMKLR